jgi:hypothetical protein
MRFIPVHPGKRYEIYIYIHRWLVAGFYPSEKYESVGMMKFPTEWKNKIHVPNHQSYIYI